MKYLDLKAINEPYEHAADEVLRSGWYLRGEATRRFEQHYAEYIGTKHCVGCANGLDALTLIIRAYKELGRLKDGDEVIVPANTYIATILSITENALVPVLVEPSIDTLQIDDTLIEQAITAKTRAIMIVHLYGRCAYTPLIGDICRRHHLLLIEDNAQAHGCSFIDHSPWTIDHSAAQEFAAVNNGQWSTVNGQCKKTGSLGHAAGHSFYPTKNLGAFGDAGAVTTDDDELAAMVRALGNYGSSRHYIFDHLGRNSRLDELQAAILDAKLPHLDEANRRRQEIAAVYINNVEHPDILIPNNHNGNVPFTPSSLPKHFPITPQEANNVYHIFPILSPRRDELRQYLLDNGLQTEIHYPIPPHHQRCYPQWNRLSLPITERIHREELSLPCNPAMTDEDARTVVTLLNNFPVRKES
jgi:dTDP-4-amino-4,6-dideoxygalactose transaminase